VNNNNNICIYFCSDTGYNESDLMVTIENIKLQAATRRVYISALAVHESSHSCYAVDQLSNSIRKITFADPNKPTFLSHVL
jgi:hypothetical protein